jgi:hypothetical protein
MTFGFLCAGFVWTLWWNIDWRRFIKFYIPGGPPYRRWVEITLRVFFAACSLGAADELISRFRGQSRPIGFYREVAGIAVIWFAVIVIMVRTVEWFVENRKSKIAVTK